MNNRKKTLLTGFFLVFLNACSVIPIDPYKDILSIANNNGFQEQLLASDLFTLFSLSRFKQPSNNNLTIYIEGDGYAWENRNKLSPDPTPRNILTFSLAAQDPSENILYLSRPCQFVLLAQQNCDSKYWSSHRYSTEVIDSYQYAINKIKNDYGFTDLILIGYSGGGVIAALLAATRDDIKQFVTIASNLDHYYWSNYHNISLLDGSLDVSDFTKKLSDIKQTHFIGSEDKIVPKQVLDSYFKKLNKINQASYILIEDFSHQCCWTDQWIKRINIIYQ